MSSEWRLERLGDYCTKIGSGATPRGGKDVYLEQGPIALIRSQNVYNDGFVSEGLVYINEVQSKKLDNVELHQGDILLNITGDSVARVCMVNRNYLPARVNQHVSIIRPNSSIFDARFVRYFLASPYQQELMHSLASAGATRNALTKGMIEDFEVPCPPIAEQQSIADILSALDDRIALLRETNATLESIAQAMFKSWFIDFDPVKAKQQGEEPQGMDAGTAALFPDAFQDSELGPIPAGWEVLPLGELVQSVGGGTPSTKEISYWEPAEFAWTTPKDLSAQESPVLLKTERMISEKGVEKISSGLLPKGTLLLSSRAPIGYLAIAGIPLCINQGYIAILPDSVLSPLYMLFWCKNHMELIKNRSNGSTFMEINKKSFREISAIKPPEVLLKCFTDLIAPVFDRIVENKHKIQTLALIRDTLLPRLISGRLRLPEAEAMVGEAGL